MHNKKRILSHTMKFYPCVPQTECQERNIKEKIYICNVQYTNRIEKICNNIEYTIYKINRRAATRWNNAFKLK